MNYEEAMEFLRNLTKFGFNFGLERIEHLLERLGNLHRLLQVIHIGGTNGKGSTAAMVASVLQAAGYRVGVFTSPHLHSYTERTRINGVEIDRETIASLLTRIRPHLEAMVQEGFEHPTEFEVSTALAFLYFALEKVDWVVLEVGLGGAIDSTNVVVPRVAVITNVAMDHMDYLGNTVAEIARVKAGIIKEGVPLVTAAADRQALEVLGEVCAAKGASLRQVGKDIFCEGLASDRQGSRFHFQGLSHSYRDLTLPLPGRHQLINAACALGVLEVLQEQGLRLSEAEIRSGLAQVRWPARLEVVREKPTVLLDGAHNVAGAQVLKEALDDLFHYDRLILVLGLLGDKEREKVVGILAPLAHKVIVTRPNSPRAGDWQQVAREAEGYGGEVFIMEEVKDAVQLALSLADSDDLVCITGSLYMVAEARESFLNSLKR